MSSPITRDYFETFGIAGRRGRAFQAADRASTDRVVVINEAYCTT